MTYSLLATVEFETIGGDPLDRVHNNFAFQSVDASTPITGAGDAVSMVTGFYNAIDTGMVHAAGGYLTPAISRAIQAEVKVYDITAHLNGSPHGSPIFIGHFSLTGANSPDSLPEGCSICVSYRGPYGTDVEFGVGTRPRARDRGRIYLGGLGRDTLDEDSTTKRTFVKAAVRDDIATAAGNLRDANHGAGHINWAVWSRSNATTKIVTDGWIDDRFDYQRRREDQGVVRTTF